MTWTVFGISLVFATAPSVEPTPKALAAKALENNLFSTNDAEADVAMEIRRLGKVTRTRRVVTRVRRSGGEVRSFVEFRSPAEVAGTKFLSIEKDGEEPAQFIFLPALKKVKRVVGSERSRSFMGTDFSYSDLEGRDVDEAEWRRLPDEEVAGRPSVVLEAVPHDAKESGYGRMVMWVDTAHQVAVRVDFFDDDKKTLEKQFLVRKLEKRNDRWIATQSEMRTVAKKTSTRLKLVSVDFDRRFSDTELSRAALTR